MSLEEHPYVQLVLKFQYLSREYKGDPKVPSEQQSKGGNYGSSLNTFENKHTYKNTKKHIDLEEVVTGV